MLQPFTSSNNREKLMVDLRTMDAAKVPMNTKNFNLKKKLKHDPLNFRFEDRSANFKEEGACQDKIKERKSIESTQQLANSILNYLITTVITRSSPEENLKKARQSIFEIINGLNSKSINESLTEKEDQRESRQSSMDTSFSDPESKTSSFTMVTPSFSIENNDFSNDQLVKMASSNENDPILCSKTDKEIAAMVIDELSSLADLIYPDSSVKMVFN